MAGTTASRKAERDQFRDQLRGYGCTTAQIAREMARHCQARPRTAWRYAVGWTQWKLAQEFNRAYPGSRLTEARISEYESWPFGGVRPTMRYLARLAALLAPSCTPEQLADASDLAAMPEADRLLLTQARTQPCGVALAASLSEEGGVPTSGTRPGRDDPRTSRRHRRDALLAPDHGIGSEEEIVMAAADQSAEFGAWAEGSNTGPVTIAQLHDQVRQLANRHSSPAVLFQRALPARNQTFDLLEGHQYPNQGRDLYTVAGWLCALLSLASNDLGHHDAAETQARTAWLCAEIADHNDLRAWSRVVQANAAYWRGDVLRAAQLADSGLRYARTGTVAIQLACIQAANLAQLGRVDNATIALRRVRDERDRVATVDEIGGSFSCIPVRQYGYTGAAHLRLDQSADALAEFNQALEEANRVPEVFDSYSTTSLLRLDAAKAHLRLRRLDAAEELIRPVLDLTPDLRNDPIIQRVAGISDLLGIRDWRGTPGARRIQEEIAAFRGDSAVRRQLPPTSA